MAGTVKKFSIILFTVFVIIYAHQHMQIYCIKFLVTHELEPSYVFH